VITILPGSVVTQTVLGDLTVVYIFQLYNFYNV